MPREAYSDQVKCDAVAMYEGHSHVSLKAAVKELGPTSVAEGLAGRASASKAGQKTR